MQREPHDLFDNLAHRIREVVRHTVEQLDTEVSSDELCCGEGGRYGRLEFVADRVYWHPRRGPHAGTHLDITSEDGDAAWQLILGSIPEVALFKAPDRQGIGSG